MAVVFVLSAVTGEFRGCRQTLRHLLTRPNVHVQIQEDLISTKTLTLDALDTYIKECNAVIHLVGDMMGSPASAPTQRDLCARYIDLADRLPPLVGSLKSGDPSLSYTQWEAYLAVYHRKRLMVALPEPETQRDANYRYDAEQKASRRAHLSRLRALGYHKIGFRDDNELAAQLLRSSILDLLVEGEVVPPIMLFFKPLARMARSRLEGPEAPPNSRRTGADIATLFEKISGCLTDISGKIREGGFPLEKCQELFTTQNSSPIGLERNWAMTERPSGSQ